MTEEKDIELVVQGEVMEEGRGALGPSSTQEEVDRHNTARIPRRSWCPVCLAGHALGSHQQRRGGQGEERVPDIVCDDAFAGAEGEEGEE